MSSGMYIVAVCAVGGLIACAAFVWALRSGQLSSSDEAKYLVFDEEDGPLAPPVGRVPPP
jgi:cbb3-type cytochrome oxidase maturation protein